MSKDRRHASSARKHAAIMFTDIVGYTALMGSDEDRAFEVLAKNREIHTNLIEQFNGILIKEMGDGMLISFELASQAVRCAIEIQKASNSHEIPLKIGIHEGEMVFEGNDVLGDGVNIASRLEASTQPGCISISGSVYHDIRNKADIQTEFLEEKQFKNVHEKIKVYQVLCEDEVDKNSNHKKQISNLPRRQAGKYQSTAPKNLKVMVGIIIVLSLVVVSFLIWWFLPTKKEVLDDEKIIAVLPFINQSEGDEYEYFGNALTDEIIQQLQKIKEFKVRSFTSVMKYKESGKSSPEIAAELKVNYIIEGRAQRYQDKVRISVQLIHANDDEHLWGDTYDREWGDIFQLQSDLSKDISNELVTALTPNEVASLEEIPTDNLEAYEYYLRARDYHNKFYSGNNKSDLSSAILLYQKAIDLDTDFALAYVWLGYARLNQTYWDDYFKESFGDSLLWYADNALEINPKLPEALSAKGYYFWQIGKPDRAILAHNKAIAINPNYGLAYLNLGQCYINQHDHAKGIEHYLKAKELLFGDPLYRHVLSGLGSAFHNVCDVENSKKVYKEVVNYNPENGYGRLGWVAWSTRNMDEIEYYTNQICSLDSGERCYLWLETLNEEKNDIEQAWYYRQLYLKETKKRGYIDINNQHRQAYLLWMLGRKDEAMIYFEKQIKYCEESIELKRPYATQFSAGYDLAGVYAFLGEREKAIKILREFFEGSSQGWLVMFIKHDPLFESLKDDEEYKTIIQRQEAKYAKIREELDQLRKEDKLKM